MRNAITAMVVGSILCGCLSEEGTSFAGTKSADTPDNTAPTISGTPPETVRYGTSYEFVPSAWDADGDTLNFDVQNLPNWATFDESTGAIAGQPTLADVGVYENIVVSVSDGKAETSLPQFQVSVDETALGNVTLSWDAPTENMDGSALNDLAGYKLYYGKSPADYDQQIDIANPSVTVYIVENLDPTTYYFAATAYNSDGVESSFSSEVARSVN